MSATGDPQEAVSLSGRLDGRCSSEVREALGQHLERHPEEDLVLDVSEVEWIDLTCLRTVVVAALRVERAGFRVVLRGASPALRRVFAMGGWRRLFRHEGTAAPDR